MTIDYRRAVPQDATECVRLRGLTRENAISPQRLAEIGITATTWAQVICSDELPGLPASWVAQHRHRRSERRRSVGVCPSNARGRGLNMYAA